MAPIARCACSEAESMTTSAEAISICSSPFHIQSRTGWNRECRLAARLYIRLGGRKVDVLIKDTTSPDSPIYRHAMQHGVVL